jgi:1-acyl-sn-glycerol-3-phosphate acyltransferase
VSVLDPRRSTHELPRVTRRRWFLSLARNHVRRQLASQFDGVYVSGLTEARAICREQPVIIAPNHVAWWDAFLVVLLDEALGTESYCLMDAQNLRRLPFFRWLGAIELARGDLANSYRDLTRSLQLLSAPTRALWIFPQGRQRPPHLRPLQLQSGVALLAQQSHRPVLPVSISYAYLDAPQPRIMVRFNSALNGWTVSEKERVSWRQSLRLLESRLVEGLDANDQYVLANATANAEQGAMAGPFEDYLPLVAGKGHSGDTPAGARFLSFLAGISDGKQR